MALFCLALVFLLVASVRGILVEPKKSIWANYYIKLMRKVEASFAAVCSIRVRSMREGNQTRFACSPDWGSNCLVGHLEKEPVGKIGRATFCRAMQSIAAGVAPYFNLRSADDPVTDHTGALVIERIPASMIVNRAQDF